MVNIAIVGTGIFARDSHVPAMKEVGGYNIVGVYNRTAEKAKVFLETIGQPEAKIYSSLDELLADPNVEAVDCLLPTPENLAVVSKVVAAGKALAIEKPIAGNVADAKEVVKLAESQGLPFLVLENWSYAAGTLKLKELLPKIGKVITFRHTAAGAFNSTSKYLATAWRTNPKFLACQITDGGVHQTALLTDVLGPVESVAGRSIKASESTGDTDTLSCLFNMKSGVFGTFTYSNSLAACEPTYGLAIYGTEGSLFYNTSTEGGITLYQGKNQGESKSEKYDVSAWTAINGLIPEFENFKEAVEGKDKKLLVVKPADAFHHFAVLAAGLESADKGGELVKVELP